MPIPGNMLSESTSTMDPDVSGWRADTNAAIGRWIGGQIGDLGCLGLTSKASGEMRARTTATLPVQAGSTYWTFSDAEGDQPERIGIQWLTDDSTDLAITWSLTTSKAFGEWHRISVAGTAPAGATQARVVLSATVTKAGASHWFENAYFGPPMRTSGNLFSFNVESGGELDDSGWSADTNAVVGREAPPVYWRPDQYYTGGEVVTLTAETDGDTAAVSAEAPPVEAGVEYIGSCYLTPPSETATCWVELRWYDTDDQLLSAQRSVLDPQDTLWYIQIASATAPPAAATCRLAVGMDGADAGDVLRFEGAVAAVAPVPVPGSVLSYEDSSFEQGTGSWAVVDGDAAIARDTGQPVGAGFPAYDGTYSLKITPPTTTASVVASGRYPIPKGSHSLRAFGRLYPWSHLEARFEVRWYDADGADLGVSTHAGDTLTDDGWQTAWSDCAVPDAATQARMELHFTASTAGAPLLLDGAALFAKAPDFEARADTTRAAVTLVLRELPTDGTTLTVYRIAGGRQTAVRGPHEWLTRLAPDSEQMVVEDYEAPLGVPVSYRMELATGGRRLTEPVTLSLDDPSLCWLKDPLQPQRNVRLRALAAPDWTRAVEQTTYRIRGRRNPVVLSDVRGGLTGTLKVWTLTDTERDDLHLALDTGNTLLLQVMPGLGIGDMYVSVGEVTEPRLVPYAAEPRRQWQLPLTEVDADAVADGYRTVLDLVLDTRET